MSRRMKVVFLGIILSLLLFVTPLIVAAQEELTLDLIAQKVEDIIDRIETLERLYHPDAVMDENNNCQIAAGETQWNDREGGMHPSTMATYLALSDGQIPRQVEIESISLSPEGIIAIQLATYQDRGTGVFNQFGAYVIEFWNGCDFQSHSRFWEDDYSGNSTYFD